MRRTLRTTIGPVALGCLLGLASVVAAVGNGRQPAIAATCSDHHVNVEGFDKSQYSSPLAYGNHGYEYVNTQSVIGSLHNDISRSLGIIGSTAGNDVEVGWFADPLLGYSKPTVFAEWVNRGADSGAQPYSTLSTDTSKEFRVENLGNHYIWRFVFDSESTPFNYSPTMNFNYGWPLTNSEHYNSCDSLYAHDYNLSYYDLPSGTWQPYGDLECYLDTSTDWYFHKISNTELDVTQNSSNCPGP